MATTNLIKPSIWTMLRRYIMIALGIMMYVVCWITFLIPNHIVGGGVVGLSSVVYIITGFPTGITNFIINAILFCFGFYFLGKHFAVSNIYGIVVTSIEFLLFQQVLKIQDIPAVIELGKLDPFVCALIGGVVSGIGIGIVFTNGGNSGGSDVIALIFNKFYNVSLGSVIMVVDAIVIISSILIPGNGIQQIVYGVIVLMSFTFTIDYVIDGRKQTYKILVFSKKNEEIADVIGNEIKRGATFLNGTGWYTKQDTKILMVVVHRNEKVRVMQLIKTLDPEAFMTIEKTEGVFGKNFEKFKN
ncbi:MAG: YitT family protein [Bacteroidales bacterium]|nr:YitT family protein [Bacteroidales bacterium]